MKNIVMFVIAMTILSCGALPAYSVDPVTLSATTTINSPANNKYYYITPMEELLVTATSSHVVTVASNGTMSIHDVNEVGFTVQWAFYLKNKSQSVHKPTTGVYSETLALDYTTGVWTKPDSISCTEVFFGAGGYNQVTAGVEAKSWVKVIGGSSVFGPASSVKNSTYYVVTHL